MTLDKSDPLFGAAILKLSLSQKGFADQPGFRVVYFGTLKELNLTNDQVDKYIKKNKAYLEAIIDKKATTGG